MKAIENKSTEKIYSKNLKLPNIDEKINIAVIGCGHWGPNHIRVFNSLSASKVIMAVDKDKKRLNLIRKTYPDVFYETDYKKALNNDDIDAVVVATPTSTHFKIVLEAIESGKHVLCEKPLCISKKEVEILDNISEKNNIILAVGYVFLFNNGILKLKELIRKKHLGTINYISMVRTNLGPIRSDVNVVHDLISHDISILNFLFETLPEYVLAAGGSFLQQSIEDIAFVSLFYSNGYIVNIRASWLDPCKVRQITVVGNKKMAVWDDLNHLGPITIYDKGVIREPYYTEYAEFIRLCIRDGDIKIPKIPFKEPLKSQNEYFLSCIRQNIKPINDVKFEEKVIKVIEAINESIKSNKKVDLR